MPRLAAILHELAESRADAQQFDAARDLLIETVQIYLRLSKQHPEQFLPRLALAFDSLGDVESDLNALGPARSAFAEAVKIYRKLAKRQPNKFLRDLALTLHSLGNALSDLDEFEAARDRLTEALSIYRKLAGRRRADYLPHHALALHNLGFVQRKLDAFHAARDCEKEAVQLYRDLAEKEPPDYLPNLALALASLGDVQNDLEDFDAAESSLNEALEIYDDLHSSEPEVYQHEIAMVLGKLGSVQVAKQMPGAAKKNFERALLLCCKLATRRPKAYRRYSAFLLQYLGAVQTDLNDFAGAGDSYRKALIIYSDSARTRPLIHRPDIAFVFTNLGVLQTKMNDLAAARRSFEEAARLYESDPTRQLGAHLKEQESLWTNFGMLHRLDRGSGEPDYESARAAFRKAIDLAENYRGRLPDRGLRNAMHRKMLSPYELLVRTCVDIYDETRNSFALKEAVHVAERSRARSLMERLGEGDIAPRNVPKKRFAEFLRLRRELEAMKRAVEIENLGLDLVDVSDDNGELADADPQRVVSGNSEKHHENLRRALRAAPLPGGSTISANVRTAGQTDATEASELIAEAEARYAALTKELRKADPEWNPDRPVNPLPCEEIQALVPTDLPTAFVQFIIAEDTAFALVLTRKKIECVRLPGLSDNVCKEAAWEWMSSYYNRSEGSHEWEYGMDDRLRVIGTGLQPLWAALRARRIRRVVLSPNRWLHIFPLHACFLADGKRAVDRFEISYAPSFSILGRCAERKRMSSGHALIVGNPTGDLPFTEAEMSATRLHYPSARALRGLKATKRKILANAGKCHLFLFTGHATFKLENPLLSALVLETKDKTQCAKWLTLGDAFCRLDLGRCALAILNGCESGLLFPDRPDEYMALSSGFLHAGAVCVLASLWAVHDLPAALLMDRFHIAWTGGASVANALTEATRWLRANIRNEADLVKRVLPKFLRKIADRAALPDSTCLRDACLRQAKNYSAPADVRSLFASPAYWAAFAPVGKGW